MQGIFKSGHEDIQSLWAIDGIRDRDLFICTMSHARFSFLLVCLKFDDKQTRSGRLQTDKLAHVSNIFNEFVQNYKINYSPGEFVTIDEKSVPFRGRREFRMYIPNKPTNLSENTDYG
ncbi:hypothetical protein NQ314_001406 [Rhamnusium bicolor]|uniref:PiggyBac transposable element-derived protein domain-containing protein n=1 Tax=Rhamnusium bicolor TaxID=1586634 RepID=A0AAV8ZUI2_9CUCU|nr:hypothetical protein NQ314_001406 [Rhamnusium bicolor]